MTRLHPQDLRAIVAASIHGGSAALIQGQQLQFCNRPDESIQEADALLAELERTAKSKAPAPKSRATAQAIRCACGSTNVLEPWVTERPCFNCGRTVREEPERPVPSAQEPEPSPADKALRKLSHALGNPALLTQGTLEEALVDHAIAKVTRLETELAQDRSWAVGILQDWGMKIGVKPSESLAEKFPYRLGLLVEEVKDIKRENLELRAAKSDWCAAHDLLDAAKVEMGTPSMGVHLVKRLEALIAERDQLLQSPSLHARVEEARAQGYRSALNDKTNGELGTIQAQARAEGSRECMERLAPYIRHEPMCPGYHVAGAREAMEACLCGLVAGTERP